MRVTPTTGARVQLALVLLIALLLTLAAVTGVGIWAGNRWAEGSQAIKDRKAQAAALEQLRGDTAELRAQAADIAVQSYLASQRLNDIADKLELDRESQRKFDQEQRTALATLLRHRPDLRDGHAGDDVLQHWNRSNAGARAEPAAAADAGQPAAAVPAATAGEQRPVGDAAGEPRPGGGAIPRLPQQPGRADHRCAGLGADGVGLVLRDVAAPGSAPAGVCR